MTEAQSKFIQKVGEMAKADTRILPSLTIAQAILESNWGKSGLTKKANALFGIKAGSSWKGKVYDCNTKECYDGRNFVDEVAAFRAYDSWEDSIADHTAFLCNLSRYKAVVGEKDYKAACKAIKAAGYATDPGYAEKLISLIEKYGLTAYDRAEEVKETVPVKDTAVTASAKAHTVVKGDTLGKLAKKYDTSVEALVDANKRVYPRISANYIQIGWKLAVSSEKASYTVVAGDNLTKIAKKHDTTVAAIVATNKAKYPKITANYIQIGWTLEV